MTYAVYAFGQWLQKSVSEPELVAWLAPAAFTLMPIFLFVRVAT
jgi:hypothetical protein